MPVILPWQPNSPSHPILQHLAAGQCVALPTESTYEVVASILDPMALERLASIAGTEPPTVIVTDEARVRGWMPLLRGIGARLYRKLGPGPLILRANGGYVHGHWSRLPEAARTFLARDHQLALRWPGHPLWADLRALPMPLVSVALPTAHTAADAQAELGDRVACIVDAGATEFRVPPTIITVKDGGYSLEREGGLTADLLAELALCRILFICTGNTCRSPMAQALCSRLLADQLGCGVNDLKQRGFCVQSAGLSAMMGSMASPDAVTVAAAHGAELAEHRSRMVTMDMLAWADHVFAMTASHYHALAGVPPGHMVAPRLLSPDEEDVADPIGGALADYQACAAQILGYLRHRLPELLESR